MSYGYSPVVQLLTAVESCERLARRIEAIVLSEETALPDYREMIDNLNWSEM